MNGCLLTCLSDWKNYWMSWQSNWQADRQMDVLTGPSTNWVTNQLIDGWTNLPNDYYIDWLTNCLTDKPVDVLTDKTTKRLMGRLTDTLTNQPTEQSITRLTHHFALKQWFINLRILFPHKHSMSHSSPRSLAYSYSLISELTKLLIDIKIIVFSWQSIINKPQQENPWSHQRRKKFGQTRISRFLFYSIFNFQYKLFSLMRIGSKSL